MTAPSRIRCPDCGGEFADNDIMPHPYLGGSAGCWAAYTELLAREYQDSAYFAAHRFTVDAYAAQHPGDQSDRRAAQSVNIHLAALWVLVEEVDSPASIPNVLKSLANNYKDEFKPLSPPAPSVYTVTVNNVLAATNAREHGEMCRAWAADVWRAWAPHHETVRDLARRVLD